MLDRCSRPRSPPPSRNSAIPGVTSRWRASGSRRGLRSRHSALTWTPGRSAGATPRATTPASSAPATRTPPVNVPTTRIAQGSQTSVLARWSPRPCPPVRECSASTAISRRPCSPSSRGPTSGFGPFLWPPRRVDHRRHLDRRVLPLQSATGEVSDGAAIVEAAARVGAYTMCDFTQASGVMPTDASPYDVTVCHTYKWLCAPRGVAFMTLSERFDDSDDPAASRLVRGRRRLAQHLRSGDAPGPHARRFDVSPAWQAWIGAEQSLALFAGLDLNEVWAHTYVVAGRCLAMRSASRSSTVRS